MMSAEKLRKTKTAFINMTGTATRQVGCEQRKRLGRGFCRDWPEYIEAKGMMYCIVYKELSHIADKRWSFFPFND